MNRHLLPFTAIAACCLVVSCDSAPPESVFGRAVLNLNMFHGFAGPMMEGQIRQPSMTLGGADGKQVVQMTSKEVVDTKITFAEDSYEKVRNLKESEDSKAMIDASKALYEYIIPVYKNEYQALAALYDKKAPQAEIDAMSQSIRDKYAAGYEERTAAVIAAAKPYAEKHKLRVKWDVGASPR